MFRPDTIETTEEHVPVNSFEKEPESGVKKSDKKEGLNFIINPMQVTSRVAAVIMRTAVVIHNHTFFHSETLS